MSETLENSAAHNMAVSRLSLATHGIHSPTAEYMILGLMWLSVDLDNQCPSRVDRSTWPLLLTWSCNIHIFWESFCINAALYTSHDKLLIAIFNRSLVEDTKGLETKSRHNTNNWSVQSAGTKVITRQTCANTRAAIRGSVWKNKNKTKKQGGEIISFDYMRN